MFKSSFLWIVLTNFLFFSAQAQVTALETKTVETLGSEVNVVVPDGDGWLFSTGKGGYVVKRFNAASTETKGQIRDARIMGALYQPSNKEEMKTLTINHLSKFALGQKLDAETFSMEKKLKGEQRYVVYDIHTEPFEYRDEQVELRAKVYMFVKEVDGTPHLYMVGAREISREKYAYTGKYISQLEDLLEQMEF